MALEQSGEGRSEAVGALQVLLGYFGSPFLPQLSLLRKKELFLLFIILLNITLSYPVTEKMHSSAKVAVTA